MKKKITAAALTNEPVPNASIPEANKAARCSRCSIEFIYLLPKKDNVDLSE